jgi:hypothetical protein
MTKQVREFTIVIGLALEEGGNDLLIVIVSHP